MKFAFPTIWALLLCVSGIGAQTIVDVIDDNGLTTLSTLLSATGLDASLEAANPVTVFGPTDMAFENLAATVPDLFAALQTKPWSLHLQNLLLAHVLLDVELPASAITDGAMVDAANGDVLTAGVTGSSVTVSPSILDGAADVVTADLTAINGVLHTIDDVLAASWLNQNAFEFLEATNSTFAALATIAGLDEYLREAMGITVSIEN